MSSTNLINFSLRQNKGIERAIVFEGLLQLPKSIGLRGATYVGLGSVWFADFVLAHRLLGIENMISLEDDPIIFRRAEFNVPYRTLLVFEGKSTDAIPALLEDEDLAARPWILWLDYDKPLDEDRRDELAQLVADLPADSVLLATFNAHMANYGGKPAQRHERLRNLFGLAAPENMTTEEAKDRDRMMEILASSVETFLVSKAVESGRPGGFVPAFRVMYVDGAPMVTVGGVLPDESNEEEVRHDVSNPEWPGFVSDIIALPPLTAKEIHALQAMLPNPARITREQVQAAGFDLLEEDIDSFVNHYLRYPNFAQLAV
jgi:hypothetical protein